MLIDGIHVGLTATFYRDGSSYLRKLEHNVRRYSVTPAAGLVALTPGCEGAGLSFDEKKEALKAVAATAAAEKVLLAGVSESSVRSAVELAAAADEAGFDALVLAAPADWARLRSRAEVMVYFRAVADAVGLPVVLWSEAAPGCSLSVQEIAELSEHKSVIGLFDSGLSVERYKAIAAATAEVRRDVAVTNIFRPVTGRMMIPELGGAADFVPSDMLGGSDVAMAMAMPQPTVKMRTKTVGFQVMAAGSVNGLLPLLEAGVAGVLPALGPCAPQACHEVYAAFKDGNPGLAAEKGDRLTEADALMAELGIAGVKYACDLNGYYGGVPRLPRLPLTGEERSRVEMVMGGLKN
ncbi:MAG: dihydrodipicolinate synthase family protein [Acidobacteriota bacterium]